MIIGGPVIGYRLPTIVNFEIVHLLTLASKPNLAAGREGVSGWTAWPDDTPPWPCWPTAASAPRDIRTRGNGRGGVAQSRQRGVRCERDVQHLPGTHELR